MTQTAITLLLLACFSFPAAALCRESCVDAAGEALVIHNDLPSAKAEALSRARWAAIEQASGVAVKATTLVRDMILVEDAVIRQISGVITRCRVLHTEQEGETCRVTVNACVAPDRATEALSALARNYSMGALFVNEKEQPGENDRITGLISGRLAEHGYTVYDVAASMAPQAGLVEKVLAKGDYAGLKSIMYRFLANIMVIGKVEHAVSNTKGEDIGHGLTMPFHHVTARADYRVVTRDARGRMRVIAAGTEAGRGLGPSIADATAKSEQALAEKLAPVILDKVSHYVKETARQVLVRVEDVDGISRNFEVKEQLQRIAWVSAVKETGLGEFVVDYSENPIYLANSLSQNQAFRLLSFSPDTLRVRFRPQDGSR